MNVIERIEYDRQNNKPVRGKFPRRPEDSKTLRNWIAEGKCPKDDATLQMYQMGWSDQGYGYYDVCDVRDMTPEEVETTASAFTRKAKPKEEVKPRSLLEILNGKPQCKILTKEDWETKEIVVFDTETTGFSPARDEVLQISAADNYGRSLDLYVRPVRHRRWDEAEAINHISPAMVANQPTAKELASRIQLLFDQADYVVGHNVDFDVRFVKACFGVTIDENKIIDTCKIFKTMYRKDQVANHKLETAVAMFASDAIKAQYADGAHSSMVDVWATLDVYKKFCEHCWLEPNNPWA